jgi:hypothetical protein
MTPESNPSSRRRLGVRLGLAVAAAMAMSVFAGMNLRRVNGKPGASHRRRPFDGFGEAIDHPVEPKRDARHALRRGQRQVLIRELLRSVTPRRSLWPRSCSTRG